LHHDGKSDARGCVCLGWLSRSLRAYLRVYCSNSVIVVYLIRRSASPFLHTHTHTHTHTHSRQYLSTHVQAISFIYLPIIQQPCNYLHSRVSWQSLKLTAEGYRRDGGRQKSTIHCVSDVISKHLVPLSRTFHRLRFFFFISIPYLTLKYFLWVYRSILFCDVFCFLVVYFPENIEICILLTIFRRSKKILCSSLTALCNSYLKSISDINRSTSI